MTEIVALGVVIAIIAASCATDRSTLIVSGPIYLIAIGALWLVFAALGALTGPLDAARGAFRLFGVVAWCATALAALFAFVRICRARARDAYGDATLWPIGVTPIVNLWFVFKSPRRPTGERRLHMNAVEASMLFFFLFMMAGVIFRLTQPDAGGAP
ncbi:MAG: hypothetical protein AAF684_05540 [Pseudomonadota bacterium]